MEFTNPQIEMDEVPDYSAVELTPVAPAFLAYSMLTSAAVWLILAGASVAGRFLSWVDWLRIDWLPGWWLSAILLTLIPLSLLWAWLDARRRGWALRQHDLIYREGVIRQRTTILPFARIQHVETASGPLERAFGLMRVKCFTAGGSTADLAVLGLDRHQARRVRSYLLERIGGREQN